MRIFFLISLFLLVSTVLPLSISRVSGAENDAVPVNRLEVSFDLEAGRLRGVSRIEVPAGAGLAIGLGDLEVGEMTLDGRPLTPDPENGRFAIEAGPSRRELRIAFALTSGAAGESAGPGGNQIGADSILLTEGWYPQAGPEAIHHLSVTLPEGFLAVSEGEEVTSIPVAVAGDTVATTFLFDFAHPLETIHLAAGPYVAVETLDRDIRLTVLLRQPDESLARHLLARAGSRLADLVERFGPYPYKRLTLVESEQTFTAAYPTFILLERSVLEPGGPEEPLVHGLIHGWFGHGVRPDPGQGNWSEGLTVHLADRFLAEDESAAAARRHQHLVNYLSYVSSDDAVPLARFRGNEATQAADPAARAVGYDKGAMFFHMLRRLTGEEIFDQGLRDLGRRLRHKRAGWAELEESFEQASGMDLGPFFKQWLERTDIPELRVADLGVREEEGLPELSFSLRQQNDPPFHLLVPARIEFTGEDMSLRVELTETRNDATIPLPVLPVELILDPGYDLMRGLARSELPPVWSRFLGARTKICIPAEAEMEKFAPLLDWLETRGCRIVPDGVPIIGEAPDGKPVDVELAGAAVVFLGTGGATSRSLFAGVSHPREGLTLDIRHHPFNPDQVAVLVSAAGREEVTAGLPLLSGHGEAGFLHIRDGLLTELSGAAPAPGQRHELVRPPMGIETARARSFASIIDELADKRVVYVGENHTSYEDHLLQLRIIRALHRQDRRLAIGMEMFDRSTQPVLDAYTLEQSIDEPAFLKQSHYFEQWRFDYRLYKGILDFARRHRLPVLGLNIDKEIVSSVFKSGGTGGLSAEEKEDLPLERDLDMAGYREKLESVFKLHDMPGLDNRRFSGFLQAQALWDETMAETAADYLTAHADHRLVVIAGKGHVAGDSAIPPRLHRRLAVEQAVVINDDGKGLDAKSADFIFFAPPEQLPPAPLLGVMLAESEEEVVVRELSPRAAAGEAGIVAGDVILAIDGQPIDKIEDLKIIMLNKSEGQTARVAIRRSRFLLPDREMEITVSFKKEPPLRPAH